jgi:hypothetical protein
MNARNAKRVPLPVAVLLSVLTLLAGCAKGERTAKAPLTEHQRDSVLATEPVPGASTVGRALDVSARASGDAAAMDSVSH